MAGHLARHAVQPRGLALHHLDHVPLADKDDKHPNTLEGRLLGNLRSVHLQHVQGVSEDKDVWVEVVGGEGEGEELKVPDDAHAKEEPQVDAHLVRLLRPTCFLAC